MEYEQSDTGNWNVAENWSTALIFKPFFEASEYLTLAEFGCSDISDDFMFQESIKIKTRIQSLKWARHKIEMGIRHCLFAIRNTNDKNKVSNYLKEVVELKEPMKQIENVEIDRDRQKITINEEIFEFIYKIILRIFTEITEPMNRSDLIFNYKEQFDPKKYKEKIQDEFIEEG